MSINEVYQLINFIANKEQSGNTFKPAQFNLLAKVAQMDFVNKRLGNIKTLDPNRMLPFGYKSMRKIDQDLRPLVYGPIQIPIASSGNFVYPYGFMWPDAVHKNDFSTIKEVDSDEYPSIKKSQVIPPTSDYPVIVYRNPYGFIDPYTIGSFSMSYVKTPPDPVWGFTVVSGTEVYNPATSVDFSVNPYTNAHLEIAMIMLAMVGINLSMDQITAYAVAKEQSTS